MSLSTDTAGHAPSAPTQADNAAVGGWSVSSVGTAPPESLCTSPQPAPSSLPLPLLPLALRQPLSPASASSSAAHNADAAAATTADGHTSGTAPRRRSIRERRSATFFSPGSEATSGRSPEALSAAYTIDDREQEKQQQQQQHQSSSSAKRRVSSGPAKKRGDIFKLRPKSATAASAAISVSLEGAAAMVVDESASEDERAAHSPSECDERRELGAEAATASWPVRHVVLDSFHVPLVALQPPPQRLPQGDVSAEPDLASLLRQLTDYFLPSPSDEASSTARAGAGAAQSVASSAFHDRSQAWMRYRGHELNRDKCFFFVRSRKVTARGEPLILYKYGYPGFQWKSLLHYQPTSVLPALDQLLAFFSTRCSFRGRRLYFNHVIATRYEREHDRVGWHSDEAQLVIVWRERGGPPVTPPERTGFGMRMIERVLASDLGGHVSLDFSAQGLQCTIEASAKGNLA